MNYDKVEWKAKDGSQRTLSPAEFQALGLMERVTSIAEGRVFFFKDGLPISGSDALRKRPAIV